jgi:hypothetical protein
MPGPEDDPLPEAVALVEGAARAGLRLRLLGGLGVRVLCPAFPPRLRPGQDMDLACASKGRRDVVAYLEKSGCIPDKAFNSLNGDRQMYFTAPSGRPIDVMVDRLVMCHTLDFRPSFGNSSLTLDPAELLLSKLQIFELNAKDARDITHLLSGVPVGEQAPGAPFISTVRFGEVLAADWGWWRTATETLERVAAYAGDLDGFGAVGERVQALGERIEAAPKSRRWRMRAKIGERKRWYELPEEING